MKRDARTQYKVIVSVILAMFLITLVPYFTGFSTLVVQRGEVKIESITFSGNKDKLLPGDILEVTIHIRNTGEQSVEDMVIEGYIYDETDDDILEDKEEVEDIKLGEEGEGDDDEYDVTFTFKIPYDVDEDNKYQFYTVVYKDGDEDAYYVEQTDDLDIERRLHHLLIEDVVFTPETLKCGERLRITTDIRNTGENDEAEEDIIFSITSQELGVELFTGPFNLAENGLKRDIQLITIPENTKGGNYAFDFLVYNVNTESRVREEITLTECILGVTPLDTASSYFAIIRANRPVFIAIDKPTIAITRLRLETRSDVFDATIKVSALGTKPTNIPDPEGKSFRFLSVDHTLGDRLSSATVEFDVSKAWINANNIDPAAISLENYDYIKWTNVPAQKISESDTAIKYTATMTELNILAITGESLEVAPEVPEVPEIPEVTIVCGNGICEQGETEENCPADCKPTRAWFVNPIVWISIGIALIVFLIGAKLLLPPVKIPRSEYKRLSGYVGRQLKQGYHPYRIKQNLKHAGWHPEAIEHIFRRKGVK